MKRACGNTVQAYICKCKTKLSAYNRLSNFLLFNFKNLIVMKKKVFNQKLSLNKETIAELNKDELMNVKGGLDTKYAYDYAESVAWYVGSRNTCPGNSTCE